MYIRSVFQGIFGPPRNTTPRKKRNTPLHTNFTLATRPHRTEHATALNTVVNYYATRI